MRKKNKHKNTIIVQHIGSFLIGAIVLVHAYPAPALAFVNTFQSPAQFSHGKIIEVTATAYSSSPEQTDASPFITASGERVRHGIIAANFLPMHTKIRIGDEVFDVKDRMNERFNNIPIIDIWMPSLAAAQAFGTRTTLIEIVQ
ncbi:MAG: 3D domain-containing protein [Patescibacteria group bacterium]